MGVGIIWWIPPWLQGLKGTLQDPLMSAENFAAKLRCRQRAVTLIAFSDAAIRALK